MELLLNMELGVKKIVTTFYCTLVNYEITI